MTVLEKIDALTDDFKRYLETRAELLKLQATDKIADSGARIAATLIIATAALLGAVFLSLWAALLLSDHYGMHAGFGIVGGAYVLLFIILWAGKTVLLQNPVKNQILSSALREDDKETARS